MCNNPDPDPNHGSGSESKRFGFPTVMRRLPLLTSHTVQFSFKKDKKSNKRMNKSYIHTIAIS